MLSPEVQQEWLVDRNMHLGPIKVKPNSTIRAVWQCNKCPAGQPHVWTATVRCRTGGTQCPYCCNKLVCLHNSLATVAPETTQFWNHTKNKKTPEQTLAGSNSRAEWKCPTCKLEWQAPIKDRVRRRAGCAKCSQVLKGHQRQPTFAEAQPACLAGWDYKRNDAEGFYPDNITLGSNKQVHWICSCCPRGQPHHWTAPPYARVGDGTGCPVCVGQQACICNSLESLFPSVAADFDAEENGIAPSEVTAGSNKKVWWSNAKRGRWRQTVDERTRSVRAQVICCFTLCTASICSQNITEVALSG